ncbi:MAG: BMP family ABC transporter substrate-binding protein [Gemmatimonadetes bacterium]|nr:MAG: BMP family ABC transporter substrate-binding protein [Gemmatimonadota bacterium]PHX96587.1 MAG: BMP family ABC transporter substrate-binding protein [Gemmatimonadota bacterium]
MFPVLYKTFPVNNLYEILTGKIIRLSTLLIVFIGVAACWPGEESGVAGFRVALLTPGPISDQSWNASAFTGLMRIRDSLTAQTSHIQVKTPADFEENFRQYGASGYSLVIGHGFEFQDAAARVASSYPTTVFVTTGGETVRPNVAALSFAFDEPSFLAGMAAAAASKTGIIACVGGTELPPVKASFAAFAAGAQLMRPDVQVVVTYLGNWDDTGAGKEQALALIQQRVDVIFQNADAAGLGVFQAAREREGVLVIGSNTNQNTLAPASTIGSVVVDVPHAFLLVAKEVHAKTFTARVIRFGTRDNVVRWEPGPVFGQRVARAQQQRIDSVQTVMRSGSFTTPPSPSPR